MSSGSDQLPAAISATEVEGMAMTVEKLS